MISFTQFAILLPLIFFAGLVDSIAGGGGLISVPAYLSVGLPPHFALGNNKFSSSIGTIFTTGRYLKHKLIDLKVVSVAFPFAIIGSTIGTKTVLFFNPSFLNYLLLILIPFIGLITYLKRKMGKENKSGKISLKKKIILTIFSAIFIGFYDGFFGPGTGSFYILVFISLLHYDFVTANANTKVLNLSSNLAALTTFLINGKIIFLIAIPCAIAGILGNYVGTHFVLKKGNKIIRPIYIVVLIALFLKIFYSVVIS